MLFYNTRWYDPAIGRFLAADTIIPQPGNPQALNRYGYVLANPLKYTDPTGHAECRTAEECRDLGTTPMGTGKKQSRDRNLTQFAIAQAQAMANSAVVQLLDLYNNSGNPGLKASAYLTFAGLVGDGKRWDLKDEMRYELGDSFLFCSASTCYWFEYSVLGNILYGYVGMEAGFAAWEVRLGAGYAEARDPENSAKCNWPPVRPIAYVPAERRSYYYDDPLDYNAVSMGIELSRRYGGNVTLQAFQALVTEYHEVLMPGTPNYRPVVGPGGLYEAGHFDNRSR